MANTTLVTFVKDVYPHCRNDVVNVNNDELKKISDKAYIKGEVLDLDEETDQKADTKEAVKA